MILLSFLRWIINSLLDLVTRILTLLGVAGIALWLSAMLYGTSLVLFSSGSMAPGIPTGAAAIAVRTPASQLEPGDVVTVPREPDHMLISHRIVEIHPVEGKPGYWDLTLKGDANPSIDPRTYEVTQAQKVLFAIPGAGYVISAIGDPRIFAILILIIIGLLFRSFAWPSIKRKLRTLSEQERRASASVESIPSSRREAKRGVKGSPVPISATPALSPSMVSSVGAPASLPLASMPAVASAAIPVSLPLVAASSAAVTPSVAQLSSDAAALSVAQPSATSMQGLTRRQYRELMAAQQSLPDGSDYVPLSARAHLSADQPLPDLVVNSRREIREQEMSARRHLRSSRHRQAPYRADRSARSAA